MSRVEYRVGIISDIHGFLIPLQLGYDFLMQRGVDQIICAGDVASFGPDPNDAIAFLVDRGVATAQGNEDEAILRHNDIPRGVPLRMQQIHIVNAWSREQLSADSLRWLSALPASISIEHEFLCVHAAPGNNQGIVGPKSLKPFPPGTTCVCAGHVHRPFVVIEDGRTWANAGSLGRPMDGDPRGALAIAERTDAGWFVETFRLELPLEDICRRIKAAGMPFPERMCETQLQACKW